MRQSVIICDENPVHLAYLEQIVKDWAPEDVVQVQSYTEGVQLDRDLSAVTVDVAILDMSMTGANSIHLGRRIREQHPEAVIILLTESNGFELGAYELRAAHYLVKPVMAYKLRAILDGLMTSVAGSNSQDKPGWLTVGTKKRTLRVAIDDIRYLEKTQRKVVIHTAGGYFDFYGTFKEIKALLDMQEGFVQCHQGYIVNRRCIAVLEADRLLLAESEWIPVSRRFKSAVDEAVLKGSGVCL